MTHHRDLSSAIEDEVQYLVGETSEKYVPQPSGDALILDAVKGLRRFKDAVRWKDFHRQKQQEEKDKRMNNRKEKPIKIVMENNESNMGMGTGLKPIKVNLSAPRASEDVEAFLQTLENELLQQAFKIKHKKATNSRSERIKDLQQTLKKDIYNVVIPTDKTNSFKVVNTDHYIKWVLDHLKKNGKEIPRATLTEVSEKAQELLDEKRHTSLSEKESEALFIQ